MTWLQEENIHHFKWTTATPLRTNEIIIYYLKCNKSSLINWKEKTNSKRYKYNIL